jgi:hypothetical protein
MAVMALNLIRFKQRRDSSADPSSSRGKRVRNVRTTLTGINLKIMMMASMPAAYDCYKPATKKML